MLNWIIDARDIRDEQAFDYGLLLKTHDIEDFLSEKRDNIFFVMASKGLGKTFVLKAKSINYARDGIPLIHDNMLVDKPGSPSIIFSKDKLSLFYSYQNWVNLWSISIGLSILKKLNFIDLTSQFSPAIKRLINLPLTTITDYCKSILSISRNEFYEITQNDLNNLIIPILKKVNTPIAAFIDNVDEYFDVHINKYKFSGVSSEGVVSKDIWYLAQMGLIEAIYQLTNNPHLKIFVSIRKEAYLKIKEIDAKAPQYKGSGIDLTYSYEELKEIFIKNILREKEDRLSYPDILENDSILSFLGIKNVVHDRTGKTEDIFDYIARHTLLRPRDFMIIGSELSRTRVSERTPNNIKKIINNVSSEEIAHEYIKEVEPHIDSIDFSKIFALIDSNILTINQAKQICCHYNNQNNSYRSLSCSNCTKNHVFCTLYMLGLLGIAKREPITNKLVQTFLTPGIKPFDMIGKLEPLGSDADIYLIHPCLYGLILKNNADFTPNDIDVVGYNCSLQDYSAGNEEREKSFDMLYDDNDRYCHVHIGAGRLGLGLVIPLVKDESKRIIVIQRASQEWEKLRNRDNITLKINGNKKLEFDVIHESADSASMEYIVEKWRGGKDLLLITSEQRYQKIFLEKSNSISTALGKNLPNIAEILNSCRFNKSINLYPFENSREDINSLQNILRNNRNLTIVPVVADKICSTRDVETDYINIEAEQFCEVTVLNINEAVSQLFGNKRNVQLTNNDKEQDFFYRKKFYIVNGVHMIMALYSYGYLIQKNIAETEWKNYALTVVLDAFDPNFIKIKNFIKIQAIRLIFEAGDKLIFDIYKRDNKKDIFQEIYNYGMTFIDRVRNTTDKVGRILKLNKPNQLEAKFKDRIQQMINFINNIDESELSSLEINKLEMLKSIIDLQEQSNMLLLKLLIAQQSAADDR